MIKTSQEILDEISIKKTGESFYFAWQKVGGSLMSQIVTEAMEKFRSLSFWTEYDWNKLESRPPEYGKYFVHRKDGKVHWETWNGSGWAYNKKVITHYAIIKPVENKA